MVWIFGVCCFGFGLVNCLGDLRVVYFMVGFWLWLVSGLVLRFAISLFHGC